VIRRHHALIIGLFTYQVNCLGRQAIAAQVINPIQATAFFKPEGIVITAAAANLLSTFNLLFPFD
jgi:hypothetical protein